MEYAQIKEWLDRLVDNIAEREALKNFNNQIRTSVDSEVLVFDGLDIIADAIGATLVEQIDMDREFHYRYTLTYRGINLVEYSRHKFAGFKEGTGC